MSSACRFFRVLFLLVPVELIIVGGMNLHNCSLVPWLPSWSISVGILWFVHCCFYFLFRKSTEKNTKGYRFIKGIFLYISATAFIIGTVLTYGSVMHLDLGRISSRNHCNPILFFSALGIVSFGYIIVAVFLYFYTFTFHFSFYEPEMH